MKDKEKERERERERGEGGREKTEQMSNYICPNKSLIINNVCELISHKWKWCRL